MRRLLSASLRAPPCGGCPARFLGVALLAHTGLAAGQPSASASVASPVPSAVAPPVPSAPKEVDRPAVCREELGDSKERPRMTESFPVKGLSGYAATLEVTVLHGKSETILPGGFSVQHDTEEAKALERAGFVLPHPDGGAGPRKETTVEGDRAKTVAKIPFLLLPPKGGRHELELPPVPIAAVRASGEAMTLCTKAHRIVVDDPIANSVSPKPKRNPEPRRQLEEWTAAKYATLGALIALTVAGLVFWAVRRWRRRPRPAPPPLPPRPPWEVALEELLAVRQAGLIEDGRYDVYFDRVSHAVRRYLGDRFGFDGLECTTVEMLEALHGIDLPATVLREIEAFLHRADLVKFAKVTPTEAECLTALERGEHIVRSTVPALREPAVITAEPANVGAGGAE